MIVPPLSLWLHVEVPRKRPVRLWLPLLLVWLLLLPFALVAVILAVLADLVLFLIGRWRRSYTVFLFGCMEVLASTHGLVVKVNGKDTIVDVTIS
jgi:hypothetical protein